MNLRPAALLVGWIIASGTPAPAQSEDDYARGAEFLRNVAEAWSKRVPFSELKGVYAQGVWVGSYRYEVRNADPATGAAYSVRVTSEFQFGPNRMTSSAEGLLDASLGLVSATETSKEGTVGKSLEIKVSGGRWTKVETAGGIESRAEGEVGTASTWDEIEGELLSAAALRDSRPVALRVLGRERTGRPERWVATASATGRTIWVGGRRVSCSEIRLDIGYPAPVLVLLDFDGREVETRFPEKELFCRPIREQDLGLDLADGMEFQTDRLAAGAALVAAIGDAWAERGDFEDCWTMYTGRKAAAHLKAQVKCRGQKAADGFEVRVEIESHWDGKAETVIECSTWTRGMDLVSVESDRNGDSDSHEVVSVDAGRWRISTTKAGITRTRSGPAFRCMLPAQTAELIGWWMKPQGRQVATLLLLGGALTPRTLRFPEDTTELRVGERTVSCRRVELERPRDRVPRRWFYTDEGMVEEWVVPAGFLRVRRVAPADRDKPLADLPAPPAAVLAVTQVFKAMKKGRRKELDALFDWDRYAIEMVPNFAGMDESKQQAVRDKLRTTTLDRLLETERTANLPSVEDIEDTYPYMLTLASERDGMAEVSLEDSRWVLRKTEAGYRIVAMRNR